VDRGSQIPNKLPDEYIQFLHVDCHFFSLGLFFDFHAVMHMRRVSHEDAPFGLARKRWRLQTPLPGPFGV
jgi:hypothetical protein